MMINDQIKTLKLAHGILQCPAYLPDATYGYVRSVSPDDLLDCKVEALVMNTFHLMQKPGSSTVQSLGGLHQMSSWQRPIFTDSGGFQAYSLIRQNSRFGTITDKGLSFQPEGAKRKFLLTPEKSIQLQESFGSDVVICLDDCTHSESSHAEQVIAVDRTITWAKRSRNEFDRLMEQKRLSPDEQPKIFAVVQGGGSPELRKQCAEALLAVGFDGYGYGGWPLDSNGNLLEDMLQLTRDLIPSQYPLHALGVGHPHNILTCSRMGYNLFDSAMPTRDARHGRLYIFKTQNNGDLVNLEGNWMEYLYVNDARHIKDNNPVSAMCDCQCCRNFSLGYLHYLFKQNDSLFLRLATIHNLRFMTQLTERIRHMS